MIKLLNYYFQAHFGTETHAKMDQQIGVIWRNLFLTPILANQLVQTGVTNTCILVITPIHANNLAHVGVRKFRQNAKMPTYASVMPRTPDNAKFTPN